MIDIEKFRKFPIPVQSPDEWFYFIEFIKAYFEDRKILRPVIVEIGIQSNLQKAFYEAFVGEHIGIDISDKYSKPDILGDALSLETGDILCKKLQGRKINLLFIDAGQSYEEVRGYLKTFALLVSDIIVLHPIFTTINHPDGTRRLWRELFADRDRKEDFNFITLYSHVGEDDPCYRYQYGTGILIKRHGK